MNVHDARYRFTEQLIRDNFLKLLDEKPLNRITVRELCDLCSINRATFYKHYPDVYGVLEALEAEILESVDGLMDTGNFGNMVSFYKDLLSFSREQVLKWHAIFSDNGDPGFITQLLKRGMDFGYPLFIETLTKATPDQKDLVFHFLSMGTAAMVEHWIKEAMQQSEEEMAQLLKKTTDAIIQAYSK